MDEKVRNRNMYEQNCDFRNRKDANAVRTGRMITDARRTTTILRMINISVRDSDIFCDGSMLSSLIVPGILIKWI